MNIVNDKRVRPCEALKQIRPELAGDVGEVLWSEPSEVVVMWNGQPKPYRVPADMIEPVR